MQRCWWRAAQAFSHFTYHRSGGEILVSGFVRFIRLSARPSRAIRQSGEYRETVPVPKITQILAGGSFLLRAGDGFPSRTLVCSTPCFHDHGVESSNQSEEATSPSMIDGVLVLSPVRFSPSQQMQSQFYFFPQRYQVCDVQGVDYSITDPCIHSKRRTYLSLIHI